MKLYLAGLYTASFDIGGRSYNELTDAERYHRDGVQYHLESYHYINRKSYVEKIRKDNKQVFLDSGAFSAFTKGVNVDIEAYCKYIIENRDIILHEDGFELASVLDGIGDPLKTWQNQLLMESLGVKPLPCFHYGEDERYLEWYMERYPYITIGGMVPISTPDLKIWLDRLWDKYLTDGSGRAKLKVHGFGLTTPSLMERYPWYSVDSSSWVQSASFGSILIPEIGAVSVSENSPSVKKDGMHITNLPPLQREALLKRINDVGFELDRLATKYVSRWTFNCYSYKDANEKLNARDCTFKADQLELF